MSLEEEKNKINHELLELDKREFDLKVERAKLRKKLRILEGADKKLKEIEAQ